MITHIVLWKLKDTAHGNTKTENARIIKERLEALNGKISGLTHLEIGFDFSASEMSADIALYSTFPTRDDLAFYQAHPQHQEIAAFVREAVSERRIIDYEI